MTKEAENLIAICQAYLAGQMSANEYVDAFEQAFWDVQDSLEEEELELLDSISLDNDLFEPDADTRSEEDEDDLIDEPELRRRILIHMEKMGI